MLEAYAGWGGVSSREKALELEEELLSLSRLTGTFSSESGLKAMDLTASETFTTTLSGLPILRSGFFTNHKSLIRHSFSTQFLPGTIS